MREVLPLAAAPDHAALARAAEALKLHAIEGVRRIVLVDGVFVADLSDLADLEDGLVIRTLREVLDERRRRSKTVGRRPKPPTRWWR